MDHKPQQPALSDEQIEDHADEWNKGERGVTIAHRTCLVQGADWARQFYEPLLRDRDERIALLTRANEEAGRILRSVRDNPPTEHSDGSHAAMILVRAYLFPNTPKNDEQQA